MHHSTGRASQVWKQTQLFLFQFRGKDPEPSFNPGLPGMCPSQYNGSNLIKSMSIVWVVKTENIVLVCSILGPLGKQRAGQGRFP